MAESKGLGHYFFHIILGIILCGVGVVYWSHFRRQAERVRSVLHLNPSGEASLVEPGSRPSADEDRVAFEKCMKDDFKDLWEHPQHLLQGEVELAKKGVSILKGETCAPASVSESQRKEILRSHIWTPQEWRQLRNKILVPSDASSPVFVSPNTLTEYPTPEEVANFLKASQGSGLHSDTFRLAGQQPKASPESHSQPPK